MDNLLTWNPIEEKFIMYIMKNGKKSLARKLLNKTFIEIKKKWQKQPSIIFQKAIENVMPKIEVRPKRVGWSIYQVPQKVQPKKQLLLASKWILEATNGNKWKSFSQKLSVELVDAASETGNAIKKKIEMYKMAEANKVFARFASL